ncbi:MAG: hypothetical protein ACK557_23430, partial [Planctomycetota bacterium]
MNLTDVSKFRQQLLAVGPVGQKAEPFATQNARFSANDVAPANASPALPVSVLDWASCGAPAAAATCRVARASARNGQIDQSPGAQVNRLP